MWYINSTSTLNLKRLIFLNQYVIRCCACSLVFLFLFSFFFFFCVRFAIEISVLNNKVKQSKFWAISQSSGNQLWCFDANFAKTTRSFFKIHPLVVKFCLWAKTMNFFFCSNHWLKICLMRRFLYYERANDHMRMRMRMRIKENENWKLNFPSSHIFSIHFEFIQQKWLRLIPVSSAPFNKIEISK